MSKFYDVIMNCCIFAAFLFSFHYVVISILLYGTDEAMKAETRIQLRKSYYVTVVFSAQ